MILDTSALPAVLLREPEAERISAASYVEAAIYVDRNGERSGARCWILSLGNSQFGSSR